MATLSHYKLSRQLCLVIACLCFCFVLFCFLIWKLSTHFCFGCFIFSVFFGSIFSPPQCSTVSQEETKMQSCGPTFLQEAHAFPAAVWPALQVGSIFSVCTNLLCILTCLAELGGALSVPRWLWMLNVTNELLAHVAVWHFTCVNERS